MCHRWTEEINCSGTLIKFGCLKLRFQCRRIDYFENQIYKGWGKILYDEDGPLYTFEELRKQALELKDHLFYSGSYKVKRAKKIKLFPVHNSL